MNCEQAQAYGALITNQGLALTSFKPVEEYLETQNRYAHLFEPVKQVDIINTIQKDIDSYWKDLR